MDVIFLAVIVLIVVVLICVGIWVAQTLLKAAKPEVERPEFQNHQAMARWIELQINNDMVSCTMTPQDIRQARSLLSAFYHDKEKS